MAKLSEETMREFINSNINCLPETTKASLDKYDLVTQYRKVRYYLGQAEKKNKPVVVNVVDQVMNTVKSNETTVEDLDSMIEQLTAYKEEVKAKQISDLEEQIKTLQGQLKTLKK